MSILGLILGASEAVNITVGKVILYLSAIPALFVPFIYWHFARLSSGEVRIRNTFAGIGYIIFYIGIAASSSGFKNFLELFFNTDGVRLAYILYGVLVPVGLIIYLKAIKY